MNPLLLLALPLLSHAQTSTNPIQNATEVSELTSLAQFITSSGGSAFINATLSVIGTDVGNQFVLDLANTVNGNESTTIFIPNDNAFTGFPPQNITDPNELAAILSYHLIKGKFTLDNISPSPNYTIVRTFMNASQLVQLDGNASQVLAITNDNGTLKVLGQNTPVNVVSAISLPSNITNKNVQAYILNAVLDPPPRLLDAISSNNLTAFQGIAQQTSSLGSLEASRGVTIFAPSNAAATLFTSAGNTTLSNANVTTVTAVIGNHVINGTTVYSTEFPLNSTSASGEPITIFTNTSGAFVSSGSSTAKIIQPDILISNGVIHVIDNVLLNLASNQTAASSAFSSATSAAATAAAAEATQTSPVGNSSPSGVGSNSSNSNSTSNGQNGSNDAIPIKMTFGYVLSIFLSMIAGCILAQ